MSYQNSSLELAFEELDSQRLRHQQDRESQLHAYRVSGNWFARQVIGNELVKLSLTEQERRESLRSVLLNDQNAHRFRYALKDWQLQTAGDLGDSVKVLIEKIGGLDLTYASIFKLEFGSGDYTIISIHGSVEAASIEGFTPFRIEGDGGTKIYTQHNSRAVILRILPKTPEGVLAETVRRLVESRRRGYETEGLTKVALRWLQAIRLLVEPPQHKGTQLKGYRGRDYFQCSSWDDMKNGIDFKVPFLTGVNNEYYHYMPLQIKSSSGGLKKHKDAFPEVPAVARVPKGSFQSDAEEVAVLCQAILTAMAGFARDRILLVGGDWVAKVLDQLQAEGVISHYWRRLDRCCAEPRHEGRWLRYRCLLPNGEYRSFLPVVAGWEKFYWHYLKKKSGSSQEWRRQVTIEPLPEEEALPKLRQQILNALGQ